MKIGFRIGLAVSQTTKIIQGGPGGTSDFRIAADGSIRITADNNVRITAGV